jgi:arylformamidase
VDDFPALIAAYGELSSESESRATVIKNLGYGEDCDDLLDLFPAGNAGSALHIFIHGGYWQELSKNESTFAGADFVDQGVSFAAIDYTLAPRARIGEMVDQCRSSVAWLYEKADELGFDREKLYLSGSSAGAHLATMVLLAPWADYGLPSDVIKGATLMSGIYDLRPLTRTYVNEPLGMDESEATRLSPLFMDLSGMPPALICWGEHETDEFKRQSQAFSRAWNGAGNSSETFEAPGCNHFDIVHTLANPQTRLGRSVQALQAG